ncbi:unnamed protein product [Acanthoscelides obtectus]|uniref:Uncharacterized protein n=1 Tax=Acanthoscelides obtectus TaxID=200917 RepID=A0A9P0M4Z7_ACAOB|nr:unnamed protein product [Acanthoscelides obtectus]CAK1644541.1 hypothetical protein AOBTE_LOCUS13863 [Acanthoscelides obtectus]
MICNRWYGYILAGSLISIECAMFGRERRTCDAYPTLMPPAPGYLPRPPVYVVETGISEFYAYNYEEIKQAKIRDKSRGRHVICKYRITRYK